jgi:hypothetical protein
MKKNTFMALGSRYDEGYKGRVKDEYFRFMAHFILNDFILADIRSLKRGQK